MHGVSEICLDVQYVAYAVQALSIGLVDTRTSLKLRLPCMSKVSRSRTIIRHMHIIGRINLEALRASSSFESRLFLRAPPKQARQVLAVPQLPVLLHLLKAQLQSKSLLRVQPFLQLPQFRMVLYPVAPSGTQQCLVSSNQESPMANTD